MKGVHLAIFVVLILALFAALGSIIFVLLQRCLLFSICDNAKNTKLVPALYIFGDSTVDAGNNNNLSTTARAISLPYGIDFNHTATGRFTNGLTVPDYFARFLGLPFAPPYMNLSELERRKTTTGLNFASASSGILPETGSFTGSPLTLDNQTDLFKITAKTLDVQNIKVHLAKSIFFISVGSNDYIMNYRNIASKTNKLFSPDYFAKFLAEELVKRLKVFFVSLELISFNELSSIKFHNKVVILEKKLLFLLRWDKVDGFVRKPVVHEPCDPMSRLALGARKFVVTGLGPVGCIPAIAKSTPHEGDCAESFNQALLSYNKELFMKLSKLQSQLYGSFFVHTDTFKFLHELKENKEKYGITDTQNACWDGKHDPCAVRDRYIYFDSAHPSQITNSIFAGRCFSESSICTPMNVMQLVSA
ncbi:GDSL esterase/lipase [Populus alba x Populus x berolinensis]|nr:GDSL esterase/lipase [Populus alba x Populus x berolinensis]